MNSILLILCSWRKPEMDSISLDTVTNILVIDPGLKERDLGCKDQDQQTLAGETKTFKNELWSALEIETVVSRTTRLVFKCVYVFWSRGDCNCLYVCD